ncbi:MAG: orotate phosphoribosyltransferase [Acidipropionibacterium acidipropionici]|jgi:orotate phosphoribosyltransferase|uniref:Orotate phosphoribosyltransferase n=2 Tax=Acidipropionibacterium acidipropionici TaxID=1748 RepID=A0A142KF05_9ACTN|nr:orotate phosphoribosyltransferase [Acidipropionibacterium acidipropionici]AFV89326.1 Orotate phosphoribosyltransferase [Acidipropionibacterium acidipropionici ATCC 4875]ALN16130.1 Orotate phosphoribosyltransferase [Acidipropionibacterium acidipropionici]AMS04693.1 Orotate phosphoribosyltransferase [Acidipropionibacterium acidipropionici]AOZ46183.1 orotate phosphoribosyltransferase [Acidipropionibacterium acidipropionici]APZ08121.1 orotate phosphoribosyltransferase [Acidipropionibacterium ac
MTISNPTLARQVAEGLLNVGAVSLKPDDPFTWASGLHSPIYCDNRVTLSDPDTRSLIASGLATLVDENFPDVQVVAGTATAGIAHAALAADRLSKPMVYVRSKPKDHGKGNQIEGRLAEGASVVMVEDLISTGGSVLDAAAAVQREGGRVLGVLAIFSYELEKGRRAFEEAGLPLYTLSNYPTLIEVAAVSGRISADQRAALATWSADPQAWSDAH